MKILITGASGFIGSFLVEEASRREMEVWAGVRQSSSRHYLRDSRIRFACLDFANPRTLRDQLLEHKRLHGGWDVIVHCAGVTKCRHREEFMKGNYQATRNLVEALTALEMTPRQFVYISSLSVMGPLREKDYNPIRVTDEARPNTASSFVPPAFTVRVRRTISSWPSPSNGISTSPWVSNVRTLPSSM